MKVKRIPKLQVKDNVISRLQDNILGLVEPSLDRALGFVRLDPLTTPGAAMGFIEVETPQGNFYLPLYAAPTPTPTGGGPVAGEDEVEDMLTGSEPPFDTTYTTMKAGDLTTFERWTDVGLIDRKTIQYTYIGDQVETATVRIYDEVGNIQAALVTVYTWAGDELDNAVNTRVL